MKRFHFRPRRLALALPLAGLCFLGCWDDDDDDGNGLGGGGGGTNSAQAEMHGYLDSAIHGAVRFDEDGDSMHVRALIKGLVAGGIYGIHVHEVGNCSTPEASGEHFLSTEPHGNPFDTAGTHHRGDLPNVVADSAGIGHMEFTTSEIDLNSSDRSVVNRAVVMHAFPDDYLSQPAGNSGTRIACGVILLTTQPDTLGVGGGVIDTTGGGIDTTGTGGGTDTTGGSGY